MNQAKFPSILEGHWQFLLCLVPPSSSFSIVLYYYYKVLFDAAQVRALSDLVSLTEHAVRTVLLSVKCLWTKGPEEYPTQIWVLKTAHLKSSFYCVWISKISNSVDTLEDYLVSQTHVLLFAKKVCVLPPCLPEFYVHIYTKTTYILLLSHWSNAFFLYTISARAGGRVPTTYVL